jgi:hypothetical protein
MTFLEAIGYWALILLGTSTIIGIFIGIHTVKMEFDAVRHKADILWGEKDKVRRDTEGLWELVNELRMQGTEPRMYTQDADLAEQLEAHAHLDAQRFKEVKEEFVRIERRAGILDRSHAELAQRLALAVDDIDKRINATGEGMRISNERVTRLEGKAQRQQTVLNKLMKAQENATQDNPTEREGSGVERTDEDALPPTQPDGQGEEGGGASGYPPVNYRRDYPTA